MSNPESSISVVKPVAVHRVGVSSASDPTAVLTAPEQFVQMFQKELAQIEKADANLERLETLLLDPKHLDRCDDRTLLAIYDSVNRRKNASQQFVVRTFELGIRTKLLEKLVGGGSNTASGAPLTVVSMSPAAEAARESLRHAIDRKTASSKGSPE